MVNLQNIFAWFRAVYNQVMFRFKFNIENKALVFCLTKRSVGSLENQYSREKQIIYLDWQAKSKYKPSLTGSVLKFLDKSKPQADL